MIYNRGVKKGNKRSKEIDNLMQRQKLGMSTLTLSEKSAKIEQDRLEHEEMIATFEGLTKAIINLKETWKSKLLWLVGAAILVGTAINVFSEGIIGVFKRIFKL